MTKASTALVVNRNKNAKINSFQLNKVHNRKPFKQFQPICKIYFKKNKS